jgi:gluconokinase
MVVLIMGVSGSGKTTIGAALARALDASFADADDFHPPANVQKMRRGVPLSNTDREPWLRTLRTLMDEWLAQERPVVLACSALTNRIRLCLGADRKGVQLVFLHGPRELLASRMNEREHFMPVALLDSQLALLEPPLDALTLDIALPPDTLVAAIVAYLSDFPIHPT